MVVADGTGGACLFAQALYDLVLSSLPVDHTSRAHE